MFLRSPLGFTERTSQTLKSLMFCIMQCKLKLCFSFLKLDVLFLGMANSVEPDQTAPDEQPGQDQHCLISLTLSN